MTKLKKSLLSVAAAMALSATALSAAYIPLTTTAVDDRWVLFGVNGFVTDGVAAGTAGVFSIADNVANAEIDSTVDEVAVSGFTVGGNDFASIKAISLTAPLEVRVDLTTVAPTWNEEEPVRTIYVDTNNDGAPNFAFTYKASLEGKKLEYTIDNGTAFELTINYVNTYDNPVLGIEISGGAAVTGTVLNELLDTNSQSAIDYDFADNPPSIANYDHGTDRSPVTEATNGNMRMYTYDSVNGLWQIFDTGNTVGTNDFDTLIEGKAYWGKIDTDSDGTTGNADGEEAGMVLGASDLNSTDYTTAGLVDGWNLLAFDNTNTKIRNSSTGMLITLVAITAADEFTISDSSRNHSITIVVGTATTSEAVAKDINSQISQAIALGSLPSTFKINAFRTAAAQIAIISNQKFSVQDSGDAILGAATSLATFNAASSQLWDEATGAYATVADVLLTDVTSVYGHNAMVVEPLVGAGTASALALGATAKVALVSDGVETDSTIITNLTTAQGNLDGSGTGAIITAVEIDLNHDGTNDHVLMAATEPFSIRDNTFTRVFSYTDSAVDGVIKITNSSTAIADQTITAAARATALQVSGDINTVGALSAGTPTADLTKIVFVNEYDNSSDFKILETTGDHLSVSTTSDDMAKGAIKGVYSLDYLAKKAVNNLVTIDIDEISDSVAENLTFDYDTVFATNVAGTAIVPGDLVDLTSDVNNAAFFDALVAGINIDLAALNLDGIATHNYVSGGVPATEFGLALITISGTDVINFDSTAANDAGATVLGNDVGVPDLGYLGTIVADITSNLRFNTEYSPDYIMDGPLFVIKEAGFKLNALVTGNMDIANGDITWSSIDLTRPPSEWLNSQDYNLFDTDSSSGYWAYLETDATANPIAIGAAVLSKNYTHHFDTPTTTEQTFNEYSGTLDVEITGIDYTKDNAVSSRVTANINGKKIELSRDGTTTSYTGKVSFYESAGISLNTATEIIIDVSDGLGNKHNETLALSTFDNVKPASPTIVRDSLDLNVTAIDADVAGIYIFENAVPEFNAETLKLAYATTAGVIENICKGMTAVTPATGGGSAIVTLKAIALDGDGVLDAGNASDVASVIYMPILKTRIYVEDIHNGGVPVATTGGLDYNSSCVSQGALTINTGVTISSLNDTEVVKLAYTSLGAELVTSIPNSIYLSDGGAPEIIAKVTYPDSYITDGIYIEMGGKMYEYTLLAEPTAGNPGADSSNPLDISGDELVGVSF